MSLQALVEPDDAETGTPVAEPSLHAAVAAAPRLHTQPLSAGATQAAQVGAF
jgi:hypothetical protein